jgi:hypothetical protein
MERRVADRRVRSVETGAMMDSFVLVAYLCIREDTVSRELHPLGFL